MQGVPPTVTHTPVGRSARMTAGRRAESSLLVEQITDLRAKMKFWVTESRIVASTDTKILLAKVDALSKETDQIGAASVTLQKHIEGLSSGKRDLLSRMGLMVPVSELHAAKAESSKLRETIDGLKETLRETRGQVEDLNSKMQVRCCAVATRVHSRARFRVCRRRRCRHWAVHLRSDRPIFQGMVARTELLAALSDAKAKQDEIEARVKDLHYMEGQLSKGQEQIKSARLETAQLRADMSCMVQRSELEGAKELLSNLEAAVAIESQKHREIIAALNSRIGSLEVEKSDRDTTIKVMERNSRTPPTRDVAQLGLLVVDPCLPDKESFSWQGMVSRSELLAAQSQAKASKDDADSKAKDLAWLEEQLKKSQEQLAAARQEVASLREEMGGMVPRSDLEAAKLQLQELEKAARLEQKKQREEYQALRDRLGAIDAEKASLENKMQVRQSCPRGLIRARLSALCRLASVHSAVQCPVLSAHGETAGHGRSRGAFSSAVGGQGAQGRGAGQDQGLCMAGGAAC
jgi:chromosome segregation ATPase